MAYVSELRRVGWVSLWFSGIPPMNTKDQVSDWNPSASWGRERCLLAVFWAFCRFFPVAFTTIGRHRSINSVCCFAGWWENLSGFNGQRDNGSKFSPPFLDTWSNKISPLIFFREGSMSSHRLSVDTLCVYRGSHTIQRPKELSRGPVSSLRSALVSTVLGRRVLACKHLLVLLLSVMVLRIDLNSRHG